jgi:hypothetical protein
MYQNASLCMHAFSYNAQSCHLLRKFCASAKFRDRAAAGALRRRKQFVVTPIGEYRGVWMHVKFQLSASLRAYPLCVRAKLHTKQYRALACARTHAFVSKSVRSPCEKSKRPIPASFWTVQSIIALAARSLQLFSYSNMSDLQDAMKRSTAFWSTCKSNPEFSCSASSSLPPPSACIQEERVTFGQARNCGLPERHASMRDASPA